MGIVKGGALRLLQTVLYALLFCCAGIILGVYGYFLSVLADRDIPISNAKRAVTGLSGAACLYLIFATILTCCLGGISFFAFLALVLDVLFVGAMIAIAVLTRDGASSCKGFVHTPIGNGDAQSKGGFGDFGFGQNENLTYSVKFGTACKLNTAAFAVAIIAAFVFIITAVLQIALVRHHKKEKRFGPSPSNNYTSGFGRGFKPNFGGMFGRKKGGASKEVEAGPTGTAVGAGGLPDTADKVEGTHTGYYTQPQGTGVNPYGYTTTTGTATNY